MKIEKINYMQKGKDSETYYEVIPPAPTSTERGGIIASSRNKDTDTVEAKLGEDGKLYVSIITDEYMKRNNPVGTGSLSMNRLSGSTVGTKSTALGNNCTASGNNSFAEGIYTVASGHASHSEGAYTISNGEYQHVQGKYNIKDTANKYAHIVGNGNSTTPSNAHTLDWDGNAWYQGDLLLGTPLEGNTHATLHGTNEGSFHFINEEYTTKLTNYGNLFPVDSNTAPTDGTTIYCQLGKVQEENRWNYIYAKNGDFSKGINTKSIDATVGSFDILNTLTKPSEVAATNVTGKIADATIVGKLINMLCKTRRLTISGFAGDADKYFEPSFNANGSQVVYADLYGSTLHITARVTLKKDIRSGNHYPNPPICGIEIQTNNLLKDAHSTLVFPSGAHGSALMYATTEFIENKSILVIGVYLSSTIHNMAKGDELTINFNIPVSLNIDAF